MNDSTILTLETLAANAWPAAEVVPLDGWRLRFHRGVTRRANSVWPNRHENGLALVDKLSSAEAFYRARGLPATFQICAAMEPPELDAELDRRGYAIISPTLVQTAEIAHMLSRLPPLRTFPAFDVELAEEYNDAWFAIYCAGEGITGHDAQVRREIMQRIALPRGFALLSIDGTPAAAGLGVVENGWMGLFCLVTLQAYRRRGAAQALLRALGIWAQLYAARHVYLQVMEQNIAARALYDRVGFHTAYRYHYREKHLPPG
ncbi:MAG: GNAT family N-acetyltransferase [Caldilineaceae bacterium]|nr:GNAT family N-acetyltransferase [Caldilineaceae bacterium]